MTGTRLPTPAAADAVSWVRRHVGHLVAEDATDIRGSAAFRGGQSAADAALASFDVTGYAATRNEVWPAQRRGASRLSPLHPPRPAAAADGLAPYGRRAGPRCGQVP